jgi:hypothetical protein
MDIETRGRPRASGERYPSGKLKPEKVEKPQKGPPTVPASPASQGRMPVSGSVWQRMLADADKVFSDAKFGTEITRLGAVGQLTASEVATGIRVASVYGRFEYYRNQRRSAASPHYIQEFISEGAGSDTEAVNFAFKEGRERDRSFNPDDRETREQDATYAFKALQRALPNEYRPQLEMLCVEDRHVGYDGLIRARLGLALAKEHFADEAKGISRKNRRLAKQRGRLRLVPPPKPKSKPKPIDGFKEAFFSVQRALYPKFTDEDLQKAWDTLCTLKAREDFRQAKLERGST